MKRTYFQPPCNFHQTLEKNIEPLRCGSQYNGGKTHSSRLAKTIVGYRGICLANLVLWAHNNFLCFLFPSCYVVFLGYDLEYL